MLRLNLPSNFVTLGSILLPMASSSTSRCCMHPHNMYRVPAMWASHMAPMSSLSQASSVLGLFDHLLSRC